MQNNNLENTDWTIVQSKKKREDFLANFDNEKIQEPCWFYNNGGCRNKDGTPKQEIDCKYLHNFIDFVKRPPHLMVKKPCDRFNLVGDCIWNDSCKYSHRDLTSEEWYKFYPEIPFNIKTNIAKRMIIENRLQELESRIKLIEFKQHGVCKDIKDLNSNMKELLNIVNNC